MQSTERAAVQVRLSILACPARFFFLAPQLGPEASKSLSRDSPLFAPGIKLLVTQFGQGEANREVGITLL